VPNCAQSLFVKNLTKDRGRIEAGLNRTIMGML
jgi:hypothetical protein